MSKLFSTIALLAFAFINVATAENADKSHFGNKMLTMDVELECKPFISDKCTKERIRIFYKKCERGPKDGKCVWQSELHYQDVYRFDQKKARLFVRCDDCSEVGLKVVMALGPRNVELRNKKFFGSHCQFVSPLPFYANSFMITEDFHGHKPTFHCEAGH